jgi:D-Tyr-tRNAtyr deacylase
MAGPNVLDRVKETTVRSDGNVTVSYSDEGCAVISCYTTEDTVYEIVMDWQQVENLIEELENEKLFKADEWQEESEVAQ